MKIYLNMILFAGLIAYNGNKPQSAFWQPVGNGLLTRWSENVTPENVLPEYPRPQMIRNEWLNLNGLWDYAIVPVDLKVVEKYDGKILVPYPVESALSGVKRKITPEEKLWYKRAFTIPDKWQDKRILLNFGAVDWETTVWVNGTEIGHHRGGYDAFTFDITDALIQEADQTITIAVWDPTDTAEQPRGKQVSNPHGIWYTAVTGIWQTVWLEPVSKENGYIKSLQLIPDIDNKTITISTKLSQSSKKTRVKAVASDGQKEVGVFTGMAGDDIVLSIKNPKLWSPQEPFLYDLQVSLLHNGDVVDNVKSYFGMRKISIGKDEEGLTRMLLNNEFVFQFGPLDQGWWPDGLYTAPSDQALKYDIEVTKKLGFNMARKHVKIEPARWYYWCDKLGLLVWQDMPSAGEYIGPDDPDAIRSEESAEIYETELLEMIEHFANHPSIVVWVPFNEGWGQFDTERITKLVMEHDPTRLVNPASGWVDRKVGQIKDIHAYPGPDMPQPEDKRAIVLGEFGGLGLPLEGHTWQEKDNWGYRRFETREDLVAVYTDLLRQLQPMIGKGLSAAVYTQTTDVEVEVNGLMTYDRAVIKMDPKIVTKLNQGYLPPVFIAYSDIFLDSLLVQIENELRKGMIYYTLDGSDPDSNAHRYVKPVKLTDSKTIKARTYWDNGSSSSIIQKQFRKVPLTQPVAVNMLNPGVKYEYFEYENEIDQLPDFNQFKATTKGITAQINLEKAERDEYFMMRFEALVDIATDGIYTFYSDSDDGTQLFIHDKLVVNNDYHHGMIEKSGHVALAKGYHPLKLLFFQGAGGKGLRVSISGPGIDKTIISPQQLFHINYRQ